MLEIENEKFENETRVKDEKIVDLENKATELTEKVLMLKFEMKDQEDQGQKMERRFKDELKDLSDELEVLKKKKQDLGLEDVLGKDTEGGDRAEAQSRSRPVKNRVSIMVMGLELADFKMAQDQARLEREKSDLKSPQSSMEPLNLSQMRSMASVKLSQETNESDEKYFYDGFNNGVFSDWIKILIL